MTAALMQGKKVLIVGIANDNSIAYGTARKLKEQGAELCITYLNEKSRRFVEPLAQELGAELFLPLDITVPGELEAVYNTIAEKWGVLHGVVHSIAFCPLADLHAPVSECSREGFSIAMDVSCYSFIEMARYAKPLMTEGGSLINYSYLGSAIATGDYNIMGVAKAGLEAATRYLARDLGKNNIRVNCISPGPIQTRAASGIKNFDAMLEHDSKMSCDGKLPTTDEVGDASLYFLSDLSRGVTGTIHYVDHGVCITG